MTGTRAGVCATAASAIALSIFVAGAPARADDATSCAEMYTQVQTLRNAHKLLQARTALRACAQSTCKDFIVKDCIQWAADVEPAVPSVVLVATDRAGNDLPGVKVSVDGTPLSAGSDGRAVEIDPGAHSFTFEALDGTKADKSVVVAEGERNKRIEVTLETPAAPTPAPPPISTPLPLDPGRGGGDVTARAASFWRTTGLVVLGAGVATLAAGAVFGGVAIGKKDASDCDGTSCSTVAAASELHSAQSAGNVSTVVFIVGGVLAAGGATTWLLAPKSVQVAPAVGPNQAALVLGGRW